MIGIPVKDRPPVPPAVTARRKRPDYLKLRRQHSVMSPQLGVGNHRKSQLEDTRFSQSLNINTRPPIMQFEDGNSPGPFEIILVLDTMISKKT